MIQGLIPFLKDSIVVQLLISSGSWLKKLAALQRKLFLTISSLGLARTLIRPNKVKIKAHKVYSNIIFFET